MQNNYAVNSFGESENYEVLDFVENLEPEDWDNVYQPEDEVKPDVEDYDDRDDLEIYDDDKLNDFLARRNCHQDEYDDVYEDEYGLCSDNTSSEWTEEDVWWALTDGMYGEMPRNPFAYDAAMEAMGF